MAKFDISLLGDKALAETFAGLTDALERKVLTAALRQGANYLKAITAPRVPRLANRQRPGKHLADTLRVKAMKRSRRRVGYMLQTGTRQELGILERASSIARKRATQRRGLERGMLRHFQAAQRGYYPAHLELGHKTEFGSRAVPPVPYMRSSLASGREAVLAVIRLEVNNGIERELVKRGF